MNPLVFFRIFDNENCPCGSGKKFKECCKRKPDQEPTQSKKPPEVQVMEQMRKSIVALSNALQNSRVFHWTPHWISFIIPSYIRCFVTAFPICTV